MRSWSSRTARAFAGTGFGAEGETFGEAVFNTGMAGYQEVLTDPSYAGQIVTMTSPHQGNYGMNEDDARVGRVQVAGFAVREAARRASSWRSEGTLGDALADAGVVGIEGIDTRRLTRRLRDGGAMRAAISTVDLDPVSLAERVRAAPGMAGADLARTVSATEPYDAAALDGTGRRPTAAGSSGWPPTTSGSSGTSCGCSRRAGSRPPCSRPRRPPRTVAAGGYDGVFLSNGPGDPSVDRLRHRGGPRAARQGADLRHLPGPPAARATRSAVAPTR